ncbi:hypothetical protein RBB78_10125 [Tunturiibacter empetritectus]|uniref:hypothetical protein n=1 Tax=Tunturiibacter empetritectus TaxID=3069691 RepID=UPI003D9AD090
MRAVAAEGHRRQGEEQVGCDEGEDGPVGCWPLEVQALADPESSEGGEQDTDDELEGVLGDSREQGGEG